MFCVQYIQWTMVISILYQIVRNILDSSQDVYQYLHNYSTRPKRYFSRLCYKAIFKLYHIYQSACLMVFQTQSFETISTEIYLLEKFQHQFCFHTPQSFCFISDGIHSARSPGSWESCMPSPRGTELCQSMENSTHSFDLTRKMNNTGKSSTKPKLFFKNPSLIRFIFFYCEVNES